MPKKKKFSPETGGKACFAKHGPNYYSTISKKYWNSKAGKERKALLKKKA